MTGSSTARTPAPACALDDLGANVRIFRDVARQAVDRGLATWKELDGPLTGYESRTLVYLFDAMIGSAARGPRDLARFLHVAFKVNPRLFRHGPFLSACRRYAKALAQPAVEQGLPGRSALYAYRRLRSVYRRLGGKPLTEALAR